MSTRITIIALLFAFLSTEASAQYHKNRRRGAILGGLAGAALGVAIGDKGDNETAGALIGGAVGAIAGGTIGHQRDQRLHHNQIYHSPQPRSYQGGHHRRQQPYVGSPQHAGSPHSGSLPPYYQPHVYQPEPIHQDAIPVVISPAPASILLDDSDVVRSEPNSTLQRSEHVRSEQVTKDQVLQMLKSGMSEAIVIRQIEIHGMARGISVPEVIQLHEAGISEQLITAMQLAAPEAAGKMTIGAPEARQQNEMTPHAEVSESLQGGTAIEELSAPALLPPPPPRPATP